MASICARPLTRGALALLFCLCTVTVASARQLPDLLLVTQAEARSHLTRSNEPPYPLLAGAAGVRGPVHFEIDVSPDGHVTAARLMHGTPLLEQAAAGAVLSWRFSPLLRDGRPIAYRTSMLVRFAGPALAADVAKGLTIFGDALLVCTESARRRVFVTAEKRCHLAGMLADRFSASDRLLPNRPRRLQGEALVELGYHEEAVRLFEQIEARMRSIPFFSLDRTMALRGLGRAYTALGRGDDAMRAYGQADRQLSDAFDGAPRNSPFRAEVAGYLEGMATDYIRLLEQAGRAADAARVRTRIDAIR